MLQSPLITEIRGHKRLKTLSRLLPKKMSSHELTGNSLQISGNDFSFALCNVFCYERNFLHLPNLTPSLQYAGPFVPSITPLVSSDQSSSHVENNIRHRMLDVGWFVAIHIIVQVTHP